MSNPTPSRIARKLAADLAAREEKHGRQAAAEYAERKEREAELLAAGEFVRDSAIGGIGTDRVAVTFRDRDGREATGEVSQEIYRALPLGEPATPADFGLAVCSIGGILWAAPIREAVPA